MKRVTKVFSLLLPGILSACTQFTYRRLPAAYAIPENSPPIVLDGSYRCFYRAVTAEERPVPGTHLQEKILGLQSDKAVGDIIELEYLWVSTEKQTVVYVSTVADRYQNRYSGPSFPGMDHPNAADFRVFLIGKVKPGDGMLSFTFYFKDGRHTDNWTLRTDNNVLTLERITQKRFSSFEESYDMQEALAHPVVFRPLEHWELGFLDKDNKELKDREHLTAPAIYYIRKGKKFELWMQFPFAVLSWSNKYIIYSPERKLFTKPDSDGPD